ncbi:hypothetical protein HQ590_13635, partial [bacterium]|nr:hypothetical protein [bacterium]
GLACLQRWREQCLDWCYDRVEPGRFADQKYLDEWPDRFAGVAVITHPGANLAPWNFGNHRLRAADARVWVDDQPLLFYHFQGLKRLNRWIVDTNLNGYQMRATAVLRRAVYRPYIRTLDSLASILPRPGQSATSVPTDGRRPAPPPPTVAGRFRRCARLARNLANGTCLIAPSRASW